MPLVDTNVLLDLITDDPIWADWSVRQLENLSLQGRLMVDPIVYAELSAGFDRIEDVDSALGLVGIELVETPRAALFLAGKSIPGLSRAGRHEDRGVVRFPHRRPCRGRRHQPADP